MNSPARSESVDAGSDAGSDTGSDTGSDSDHYTVETNSI